MLRTMHTATNTLSQLQTQLDNISQNITNSNTTGYKSKQANFSEMLYQQFDNEKFDRAQRNTPVGIRYGVGAQISQIQANQKQGSLQQTARDLDFSLTKPNQYFNVLMQDGDTTRTAYTRNGAFYVSPTADGIVMLVNSDGNPVADENGNAITFPDDATGFTMNADGTLNVSYANGQALNFGLAITTIQKPQVMESLQGGTYIGLPADLQGLGYTEAEILTDLRGVNRAQVGIEQGTLEMSNVDLSKEMTNLISTQRSYQFNTRAVSIADQMLGLINSIR
jgi:flagellar basal-body rod protein FlgG